VSHKTSHKLALSGFQSGFRKQHRTTTAALKAQNGFKESVDKSKHSIHTG